jgi:histone H3/H4
MARTALQHKKEIHRRHGLKKSTVQRLNGKHPVVSEKSGEKKQRKMMKHSRYFLYKARVKQAVRDVEDGRPYLNNAASYRIVHWALENARTNCCAPQPLNGWRFKKTAVLSLHQAASRIVYNIFRDAYRVTKSNKHVTLQSKAIIDAVHVWSQYNDRQLELEFKSVMMQMPKYHTLASMIPACDE